MQTFIGFDDNALAYNRDYTISTDMPGIVLVNEGFVSPIWPSIEGNFLEEVAGGAFDAAGRFVEAAGQPRSEGRNAIRTGQTAAIPAQVPGFIGKAVFGGVAFDHFGHFLLETSARLWCLQEYRDLPWLFLTDGRPELKAYQRDFLLVLGLAAEQIVPISDWSAVAELIVPAPSFVYHHHVTHAYRDIFRRSQLPTAKRGRKVFLSRVNTTIALTVGEKELESVLAQDGWDIVYPETLPAAAQAALFREDNILLGLQGSAMHLGLFAPQGRRVIHLCRGLGYRGYYILDDLMEAQATYFNAMRQHELTSKPISGPFLLDLDKTISFLRDQELLSPAGVAGVALSNAALGGLDADYAAWWHFTESQIRFHHQIADDGSAVPQTAALESALLAVEFNPRNRTILCHAVALLLKFKGAEAAGALVARHDGIIATAHCAEDAELLYYLSIIRDQRGDHAGAALAGAAAVAHSPKHPSYVNQYAAVLFRMARLDEAEALLLGLLQAGAAVAGNLFLLSLIARERDDQSAAMDWAKQAVKADRHDEGLCRHLVNLLAANGRPAEILLTLQGFLERQPNNVPIILEAAALAQTLNNAGLANTLMLQAYELDLDSDDVAGLATRLLTENLVLPDLSRMDATPAPALQDQGVMIYRRSLAIAEQGNLAQALQLAGIAVSLFAGNATIMGNLIALLVRSRRLLEAHLLARALLARPGPSGSFFYAMSLIESELGRGPQAREAARQAAALTPDNAQIVAHYQRFALVHQGPADG